MKLPKNIRLLDHKIRVKKKNLKIWNDSDMGRCDIKKSRIDLRSGMSAESTAITLLHEITHLTMDICSVSHSDDENLVSTVAAGFYSFLVNNEKIVHKIIKEHKKNATNKSA